MLPGEDKCTECTGRSVQCISQEPVALDKRPRVESKQGLQERIVRLESTVQAIIDRLEKGDDIAEVIDQFFFLSWSNDLSSISS